MKFKILIPIILFTCLSGCELLDSEPDYHVEKYFGTYRCNYHYSYYAWEGPDSNNLVRDSVNLVISRGTGKNKVTFSTPSDSLFKTPRTIQYSSDFNAFASFSDPNVAHQCQRCVIKFNGDSVRLDFEYGTCAAEHAVILIGVKVP